LITVRLVSINDVYDLTKLPKLATFVQSLGKQNVETKHHRYDTTIPPSAVTLNGDFLSPSSLSSIDNGRGHVAAIRSSGITHVSIGNHEADLQLNVIKERLGELSQRGRVVVLNSNISGLGRHTQELDIVSSNCGKIRVGLIGLLSDEKGMFRDNTFRGLKIANVEETYEMVKEKVNMMKSADCIVPLTHQSLGADVKLAKHMLKLNKGSNGGAILGGHEHVKIYEHVSDDDSNSVQIVKTGMNSDRAAIIDLQFNPSTHALENTDVYFEEMDENYQPCPITNSIVTRHLSALDDLQDFVVFDRKTMLSRYFIDPATRENLPLSSELTRYEQTTVGALFCHTIKSELNVDVCIINGAPIKGSKIYTDGTLSYDDLRNELPFPLKIIVVEMTRKQLREAIEYSRTNVEEGKSSVALDDGRVERRGYLQTDFDYWKQQHGIQRGHNDHELLTVALPRNLLKGFCKIQPLVDLYKELEAKNTLPNEDDYLKAIDLIVRYCCKDQWSRIAQKFTFADLDLNNDGALCRNEIRLGIKAILGDEPSSDLVDSMLDALDDDADGTIDELEFNKILSKIRNQKID